MTTVYKLCENGHEEHQITLAQLRTELEVFTLFEVEAMIADLLRGETVFCDGASYRRGTMNKHRGVAGGEVTKPDWWPRCPFPEAVFTMQRDRYAEIVPDPDVRTGLSGLLGREFWNIASEAIWEAFLQATEDGMLVVIDET